MLRKAMILMMIPSVTSAHDGVHFHPHGSEIGWIFAVAILLIAGVAVAARWRR